jgi:hypothetical protein
MSELLVGILAVWRVTHLLWGEDGPGDVFVRLRRAAGHSIVGRLLDCFYCLSIWIAVPAAWVMGKTHQEQLLEWLALSGGAIILERLSSRPKDLPPTAVWHEDALPKETEGGKHN